MIHESKLPILWSLLLTSFNLIAQNHNVGIGTTTPDSSAALEIEATDKGLLIPRMDSTARKAIGNPAKGLMVYDSTTHSFWFFQETAWMELKSGIDNRLSDSDNDTKILVENNSDEDQIRFNVSGYEAMLIGTEGNVGIGTTSPDTTLHLIGQFKYEDGEQAEGYVLTSDSNGAASWKATSFSSLSTNTLSLQDGCATNPITSLDANNTASGGLFSSSAEQWQSFTVEQSGTLYFIELRFDGSRADPLTLYIYEGEGVSQYLDSITISGPFQSGWNSLDVSSLGISVTAGEQFTFQLRESQSFKGTTGNAYSDGSCNGYSSIDLNFMIYVLLPCENEVISLSSDSIGILINGVDTLNFNDGSYLTTGSSLSDADDDTKIQVDETTDEDFIRFDIAGTEAMVIDTASNLGLGIQEPLYKLHIGDDMLIESAAGAELNLLNTSSGQQWQVVAGVYAGFEIGNLTSGDIDQDAFFFISDNGEVGIGTTQPSYALQVGQSGDGTQARANAWNTFSDRRWKKDFIIVPEALAKLDSVNGYYYHWKEGADTTQQLGVIAQEIEEILPQCVSTDANGYKSVDYGKLAAWLIQVNKEQQEVIIELLDANEALESELNAEKASINERLASIENKLGIDSKAQNP